MSDKPYYNVWVQIERMDDDEQDNVSEDMKLTTCDTYEEARQWILARREGYDDCDAGEREEVYYG